MPTYYKSKVIPTQKLGTPAKPAYNASYGASSFDAAMPSMINAATNVAKAIQVIMKDSTPVWNYNSAYEPKNWNYNPTYEAKTVTTAKSNNISFDENLARILKEEEYENFARSLQAIEDQKANDAAIAKLLQADEDEAFARMLQEQEDADFARSLQAIEDQKAIDADFAYALSLQFSYADEIGSFASHEVMGVLGQEYYNAFYAA